jgi:hypothetical protein
MQRATGMFDTLTTWTVLAALYAIGGTLRVVVYVMESL